MDDQAMSSEGNRTQPKPLSAEDLVALVGSRLCHDLISPLGAIGNGLELLQYTPEVAGLVETPEIQLINQSVEAARVRINWFRVAFGQAGAGQRLGGDAMARLFRDADREGRIRLGYNAEGDLSRSDARLILLGIMCLEVAMPWGGFIKVSREGSGWKLVAEAERIKANPALWGWLNDVASAGLATLSASEVQFGLMRQFATQEGRKLSWSMDERGCEIAF